MQKAIVVRYSLTKSLADPQAAQIEATQDLDSFLSDGWKVIYAYPMSGSGHDGTAVSLVIIEKPSVF